MNMRKELEALRDRLRDTKDIGGSSPYRHCADRIDALLQRIPYDWELRPREPSEKMAEAAETNRIWQAIAKENWRTMWNACKDDNA